MTLFVLKCFKTYNTITKNNKIKNYFCQGIYDIKFHLYQPPNISIKYLGINLTKDMQYIYNEYYKKIDERK